MKEINKLIIICSLLWISASWALTPEGKWIAIDDKTGVKRAIVDFRLSGNTLHGTIVKIFKQPGDTGICSKCPGNFKDKPVMGLRLAWGLTEKSPGIWDGGHILDAKTGKIYRLRLQVKKDTLYLRGYVGIAMLGKTQLWKRSKHQDLTS